MGKHANHETESAIDSWVGAGGTRLTRLVGMALGDEYQAPAMGGLSRLFG